MGELRWKKRWRLTLHSLKRLQMLLEGSRKEHRERKKMVSQISDIFTFTLQYDVVLSKKGNYDRLQVLCMSSFKEIWGDKENWRGSHSRWEISAGLCGLCVCVRSCVWLSASPWTVAHGLLCPWTSPGKSTGVPFPPPGDLPSPGTEPRSPVSPALKADSLPLSHQRSPWSMQGSKWMERG